MSKSKIGGKKREQGEFSKKVGLFLGEVIAVNPSAAEYVSILGFPAREDAKEMVYTGESKEGNPYTRLDIWINETKVTTDKDGDKVSTLVEGGFKNKVVFFLEDRVRENRDKTKTQFINDVGICSWATTEEELPSWFSERNVREAKSGEEELYNFMRNWLGEIDFFNKTEPAELVLDWKKLMKGTVSDLTDEIAGEWSAPFVALACVITKEVEGEEGLEIKEYQSIYNKAFCPEFCMKHFRVLNYDNDMVRATVEATLPKERKLHEKFVANVIGEYGCKDFYLLSELKNYDSSMNVVASGDTMVEEEGDSSPSY